jgi:RimJ/RimL family protein N-acetyltransferase
MRDNWGLSVLTPRLLLAPYHSALILRYHGWMQSAELRAQTSSEELSEEEERDAQRAWRDDPEKCTFIVFDRAEHTVQGSDEGMCGDVNLFLLGSEAAHEDYFTDSAAPLPAAEVMVMIAEPCYRRRGYASEAVRALMLFGQRRLGLRRFVAKIDEGNAPSLALFAALGFKEAKRVSVFKEVHLALQLSDDSELLPEWSTQPYELPDEER